MPSNEGSVTTSTGCTSVLGMIWNVWFLSAFLLANLCGEAFGASGPELLSRPWFEARSGHFNAYSCGNTQDVARLVARLEQFRDAYFMLAGSNAVVSPPIEVIAFPDHESMEPFLPVYRGKPANLAAFFSRGSDENIIVLYLSASRSGALGLIFHEYTHLLLRRNQRFWPLWLIEGMAEIYATFELTGGSTVRIANPIASHLRTLEQGTLMPLKDLFAVSHDAPEYNERDRQGIFYSESWLLAHYLVSGGNPALRNRFGQLTTLLRAGQSPEQAFTNAIQISLAGMENELRRYLEQKKFPPLALTVRSDLTAPRMLSWRPVLSGEVCFRLGDELLRIGRTEKAAEYFQQAKQRAPDSPLSFEGLGLLAAEQHNHTEAVHQFGEAIAHGSTSFMAHYMFAREKLAVTAKTPDRYSRIKPELAVEIRAQLKKSLALMPDFGPAHHLLGFLELVQQDDLAAAERHLQKAIQLEPENQSYPFSLAQAQLLRNDLDGARRTLEPLRMPYVEPELRQQAEAMLKEIHAKQ